MKLSEFIKDKTGTCAEIEVRSRWLVFIAPKEAHLLDKLAHVEDNRDTMCIRISDVIMVETFTDSDLLGVSFNTAHGQRCVVGEYRGNLGDLLGAL